jgi:hypothetical protein
VNHVPTELVSDNLLQEARDWAKLQLFGNTDNNVQYYKAVKAAIIGIRVSFYIVTIICDTSAVYNGGLGGAQAKGR